MYFVILAFIVIASSLVWYLLRHDHGRKLPIGTLWIAFGFGILAMVLAMIAERLALPKQFTSAPAAYSLPAQLGWFLTIGLIEEIAKFVPLAISIYRQPYFREHTDGCIYFALCGLTFGLGENILYTVSYGTGVGVSRLLLTPFLHAATTSILGYYLVNRKLRPSSSWLFALACVTIPVMHGVYDFGLGAGIAQLQVLSLMLTLLLTLGLFLYFMQANTLDKLALARVPMGLMSVQQSTQHFCTGCGQPNVYHRAYCEYCGRKL